MESSDTVDKGSVIRVSPEVGTSVEQDSAVTIWVSTGREQVKVPTINAGDSLANARAAIEGAGLTVKVDGDSSDNATVESISPASGTDVDKGSEVTVKTKQAEPSPSPTSSSPSPSESGGNGGGHDQH